MTSWASARISPHGSSPNVETLGFVGRRSHYDANLESPILGNQFWKPTAAIDYFLSSTWPSTSAMVERNEKGKQAPPYFIEMEKRAQQPALTRALLNDRVALRQMLLAYDETG